MTRIRTTVLLMIATLELSILLYLSNPLANYAKVERKMWRKRCWDSDTKTLAAYLLSGPHGQAEGYYYLPKAYICDDLGWSSERLAEPFAVLLADEFFKYDEDACVVLVINALRYNAPDNKNQAIAAVKKIVEVPESLLICDFQRLAEGYSERLAEQLLERYGEGYGNPPTPTPPPTPSPETPTSQPAAATDGSATKEKKQPKRDHTPSFEEFWSLYPRKIEKTRAFRCWNARLKEGESADRMIAAARHYGERCEANRTPKDKIKHGSTFLSADRPYEDYVDGIPDGELQAGDNGNGPSGTPQRPKGAPLQVAPGTRPF